MTSTGECTGYVEAVGIGNWASIGCVTLVDVITGESVTLVTFVACTLEGTNCVNTDGVAIGITWGIGAFVNVSAFSSWVTFESDLTRTGKCARFVDTVGIGSWASVVLVTLVDVIASESVTLVTLVAGTLECTNCVNTGSVAIGIAWGISAFVNVSAIAT